MLIIRKMNTQDSAAVADLTTQLGYKTNILATTKLIAEISNRPEDLVLVAVVDEYIAGWVHAFQAIRLESGSFVEIGGLVEDARYRGRGIGKMLIEEVKKWSDWRQVNRLKVRCSTKRLASHRFYRNK
ncbi:MAG: family N-acetyltransferase [Adhaeribacter sp.]|jgi:GNAT superfamily N-acetyltransferase|nr:family N-acetyltransferase [Adhaeribacter sp.]